MTAKPSEVPEPNRVLAADPPNLSPDDAQEGARTTFGVAGRARPLVSERRSIRQRFTRPAPP